MLNQSFAQQTIEDKEKDLKNIYGIERLKALNELTDYYHDENPRKAFRYARQAVMLGENIYKNENSSEYKDSEPIIRAYFQLGKILYDREKFLEAKSNLDSVILISEKYNNNIFIQDSEPYRKSIQAKIDSGLIKEGFLSKTIGKLEIGKTISETSSNLAIQTELKIASANEKNGDFQGAINHYEKAINLLRNEGEAERIRELQLKVAVLLDSLGQHIEAQKLLNDAIIEIEKKEDLIPWNKNNDTLEKIPKIESFPFVTARDSLEMERENLKDLAESFLKQNNYEKSLEYIKMYQELSAKMEADSLKSAIAQKQKEDEILLLKQQKEIADLNVEAIERENEKQERFRNTVILIALLILMGTIVTLYFYLSKRKEHRKLTIAYDELDKTRDKLEKAETRIVTLLKQQISGDVATELLTNNTDKPGESRFVCIMFLDIRDFTPMAEKLSPEKLIAFQNEVFGFMIDIVLKHHGIINQLLGDGFMATFGAPVSHGNDCQNAFDGAQKIIRELEKRKKKGKIKNTNIGIGLHAGQVVTGNVGSDKRKQYSVTGNTVIIASRVEQLNKKYNSSLILTEEVYNQLDIKNQIQPDFAEENIKGRKETVKILKIS